MVQVETCGCMYVETTRGVTLRIDAIMQWQAWVIHVETTGDGLIGIDTAIYRQAWVTVGVVFYTNIFCVDLLFLMVDWHDQYDQILTLFINVS